MTDLYIAQLKLKIALLELAMTLVNSWFGHWGWGGTLYQRLGGQLWLAQEEYDIKDE
jgi:hypothetical protein